MEKFYTHDTDSLVTQETLVDSMELPPDLDVTPDDPEYEQVVNMWTSIARNHTMDEVSRRCQLLHFLNFKPTTSPIFPYSFYT